MILTISEVAALYEMVGLLAPAAGGIVEFERPEEVCRLLEMLSACRDFVHQILDANDSVLSQLLLDLIVAGQWSAFAVDLEEASLVD